MGNFHPREVVVRGSETQLKVGENLKSSSAIQARIANRTGQCDGHLLASCDAADHWAASLMWSGVGKIGAAMSISRQAQHLGEICDATIT